MCIQAIIGRILPFRQISRATATSSIRQTGGGHFSGSDAFILSNPDLLQKRQAVVKYLNTSSPSSSANVAGQIDKYLIDDYLIDSQYDNKVGEILDLFGNDLSKIGKALGLYGLAEYAEVKPSTIIKNRNPEVREIGYDKEITFKNSFYTYLLANENSSREDLYSRFGQMGASLYEGLSVSGYVKQGDTLKLTDLGRQSITNDLMNIISEAADKDVEALLK